MKTNSGIMRKIYTLLIVIAVALSSCITGGKNKMSHKKASSSGAVASESKKSDKKVRANYRSNKFHPSASTYEKVEDPTLRAHKDLKESRKYKKYEAKRKNSQAQYLNTLNKTNKYKDSKVNSGKFSFY